MAKYLNIGGGSSFLHEQWLNLDSNLTINSGIPFVLSETCNFPIEDHSIDLVYSSHTFEHLNDDTVARCLEESRRVMTKSASLLIQIPNFDLGLHYWRQGSSQFVDALLVRDIVPSWKNRGVSPSLDNLCSTLFCAFWNRAYGNHYGGIRNMNYPGYHGPPLIKGSEFDNLKHESPHNIASYLAGLVESQEQEGDYFFNHRNAWSESEFCELLYNSGYKVRSTYFGFIHDRFNWIPDLSKRSAYSCFFLAETSGEK